MSLLEEMFKLELVGDAGAARVWQDLAREAGIAFETISDDEAEYRRVQAAACEEFTVTVFDGIPRPPRVVRCGGLRAIEPSVGGDLKGWMAARVARLWRAKGNTLFRYVTKRKTQMRQVDDTGAWSTVRAFSEVRKKQRWETRDYVDLEVGDSPPHLSGFPPSADGKSTLRGVSGPRREREGSAPAHPVIQPQLNFTGGRP